MGYEKEQPQTSPEIMDEAVRVELTSRAGGMKTRNLVKHAEEILASNSPSTSK